MNCFKDYRKKNVQPMRPYVLGEDMNRISVSAMDALEEGGMIAQNPDNSTDQWYVAKQFFEDNYLPAFDDSGISGNVLAEVKPEHSLRQIIEIGCVFIADWGDEFRLMKYVSPVEAQFDETHAFVVVKDGADSYQIAVLVSFIVAEHMKDGKVELPDFLLEGIKFGADLQMDDDPGSDGNVGTLSDNVNVELLGPDGHPARKMLDAISPTNCAPEVRPTP